MLVIKRYLQYLYQIVIIYSVLSIVLTQNFNNNNNNAFHNVIINNTNVSINDWLTTRPLTHSSQTLFTSHTPNTSFTSWTLSPYLSCHNDNECSPNSHCTQDSICICDHSFTGIVFTYNYI